MSSRCRKLRPHCPFKEDELVWNVSTKGSSELNCTNSVLYLITLISSFQALADISRVLMIQFVFFLTYSCWFKEVVDLQAE